MGRLILRPAPPPVGNTPLALAAAALSAGQWAQFYSTPGGSGSIFWSDNASTGDGTVTEYSGKCNWDAIHKKLVIVGCAHEGSGANAPRIVSYDEDTDTWTAAGESNFNSVHSYDHFTIDPSNGDLYYLVNTSATFNRKAYSSPYGTAWTIGYTSSGGSTSPSAKAAEWFPTRDGGATLLFWNVYDAQIREWNRTSWSTLVSNAAIVADNHGVMRYSAGHNCVYFGGGNGGPQWNRISASGVWTKLTDAPHNFGDGNNPGQICVDPVTGNVLLWRKQGGLESVNEWNGSSWVNRSDLVAAVPFWDFGNDSAPNTWGTVTTPCSTHGVIITVTAVYTNTHKVYLYKHSA